MTLGVYGVAASDAGRVVSNPVDSPVYVFLFILLFLCLLFVSFCFSIFSVSFLSFFSLRILRLDVYCFFSSGRFQLALI